MRYASFFTGAMGLDLGLELASWECVFANEMDRVACKTIRCNRPQINLLEGDVRQIRSSDIPPDLDMIVGGPPCQAFSTAGKRLGLNDERGNVFIHFVELALRARPKLIVIENVRGLLSAPLRHRPHCERGFGFAPLSTEELRGGALTYLLGLMREAGYETSFDLYDTANFGVPQRRERLVLFACLAGRVPYMSPTHSRAEGALPRWVSFQKAVVGLPKKSDFLQLRDKQSKYIKLLGPGQNWRDLPLSMQREALGNVFHCAGGRTGFLRRLSWTDPSPTLVTSPTMPATLLAHPVEDRPLSVQEYARLQTFPDCWTFVGTLPHQYRQIGNAVPVLFGKAIGLHAKASLFAKCSETSQTERSLQNSRYRRTDDKNWCPDQVTAD